MRQVRRLSTKLLRRNQALFEDLTRPFNEKQKKVAEKEHLKTLPKFNVFLGHDAERLLTSSLTKKPRKAERQKIHDHPQDIVQQRFGDGFTLEDISMRQYVSDIEIAPFEFVVVDKNCPNKSNAGVENARVSLPCGCTAGTHLLEDPGNPSILSTTLRQEGFGGCLRFPRHNVLGPISPVKIATRYATERCKHRNPIVQGPVMSTKDHAEDVQTPSLAYFTNKVSGARRLPKAGYSLSHVFSTALDNKHRQVKDVDVVGSRREGIPSAQIRGYHTPAVRRTDVFALSQVPAPVLQQRAQAVQRIEGAIQGCFGRKYRVKLFGSTCYGADSAASDLDLVIVDPDHPTGFPPKLKMYKLPIIYNVKVLGRVLLEAGFKSVVVISNASVPIVKFIDPVSKLACDLNVNEQLGYRNTRMIKQYCAISPLLREVITFIKCWAKPLGLNDPSGKHGPRTFSSYALTLMTIGLFQSWGLLPNLQHGLKPLPEDPRVGVFWTRLKKDVRLRCDVRFNVGQNWAPQRAMNLQDALRQWFDYWGNEHQYEDTMVDIRLGGVRPRCTQRKVDDQIIQYRDSSRDSGVATHCPGGWSDEKRTPSELQDKVVNSFLKKASIVSPSSPPEEFDEPLDLPSWIKWASDPLCVPDPFITSKNVVSGVGPSHISRFREDCRRVVKLLDNGQPLEAFVEGFVPFQKAAADVESREALRTLFEPDGRRLRLQALQAEARKLEARHREVQAGIKFIPGDSRAVLVQLRKFSNRNPTEGEVVKEGSIETVFGSVRKPEPTDAEPRITVPTTKARRHRMRKRMQAEATAREPQPTLR